MKAVSECLLVTSAEEGRYVFTSVCLFVCPSKDWKSYEWILMKFLGGVGHGQGTMGIKFGDDPDHRLYPGVQIPKSRFTGLSNYQRILMKFYGELGCGLETNWLHFGDDPHHYPDPGVRGSGKNCHNSIMLAFGGGLCSLSTSSLLIDWLIIDAADGDWWSCVGLSAKTWHRPRHFIHDRLQNDLNGRRRQWKWLRSYLSHSVRP